MIHLKKINFAYSSFERKAGFLGALSDFYSRKVISVDALKNINFDIAEGEIVGLLGPNGAGKTTLIKMMTGILVPTSGDISCNGHYPYKKDKAFLKDIGVVLGQKSQRIWDLPAHETLKMLKEIYGIQQEEFDHRLMLMCELLQVKSKLNIPVRKLSLGERVKFEIICALIHSPKVLFLDEPTIGLDITSQKAIRSFLKEINATNKVTIVLTSHYMRDIEDVCKRVIILLNGQVSDDVTIEELKEKYNQTKLVELVFRDQVPLDLAPFGQMDPDGKSIVIKEEDYLSLQTKLEPKDILSINVQTESFEDIIYQLFSNSRAEL